MHMKENKINSIKEKHTGRYPLNVENIRSESSNRQKKTKENKNKPVSQRMPLGQKL